MAKLRSHPALVIVDMQNGFCHSSGSFSKLGLPTDRHRAIVPTINKLRAACHANDLPIFFLQLDFSSDFSDSGLLLEGNDELKKLGHLVRGSWDAQIVDELAPETSNPNEIVVAKTRNTGFWRTSFEEQLKANGVDQLLVTGVGTNVCVESTVRDAWTNGWHVLTLSDATATLSDEDQKAALRNFRWFGGTASSVEVLDELAQRGKGGG